MITRRGLLRGAAVVAGAEAFDQSIGVGYDLFALRDKPQVEVALNPESNRTIIVAGGLNNDGIAVGRCMRHALLPLGSIIAVRYAETNLSAAPLRGILGLAIKAHGLETNTFDTYLNSEAGLVIAEPLRGLKTDGVDFGTMVLDSCPASDKNVQGFEGSLVRDHGDLARYSRVVDFISRIVAGKQMPPASDKEAATPLAYAQAHRAAIVGTDSITTGMEAGFLRDHPIRPGSMENVAARAVYMRAPTDPLIDTQAAFAGWQAAFGGSVELVTDPYRPIVSHAAGATYPHGVAQVLAGTAH